MAYGVMGERLVTWKLARLVNAHASTSDWRCQPCLDHQRPYARSKEALARASYGTNKTILSAPSFVHLVHTPPFPLALLCHQNSKLYRST